MDFINDSQDPAREHPLKVLNLRRPIYLNTASYGHFGREEADFTWEKTDKVAVLKEEADS